MLGMAFTALSILSASDASGRPSRRPLRGLLRMTELSNATHTRRRHPEERPQGASRRTHDRLAAKRFFVLARPPRSFALFGWRAYPAACLPTPSIPVSLATI